MKHPLEMLLSFHPLAEKSMGVFIQIKLGVSGFKILSVFSWDLPVKVVSKQWLSPVITASARQHETAQISA